MRYGVGSNTAIFLLFATLIGSFFNIPITDLPPEHAMSHHRRCSHSGADVDLPAHQGELWVKGTVATAIVALAIHWMTAPVPGLGIAVPVFMPRNVLRPNRQCGEPNSWRVRNLCGRKPKLVF